MRKPRGRYLKGRLGDAFQVQLPDGVWSREFIISALGVNTIGFWMPNEDARPDGTGKIAAPRSMDRAQWDRDRAIGRIRRAR